MRMDKLLDQSHALALKTKPWILKKDTDTYTAVYSMKNSHYEVFKNGEWFLNINMKSPTKAKQFLNEWLVS